MLLPAITLNSDMRIIGLISLLLLADLNISVKELLSPLYPLPCDIINFNPYTIDSKKSAKEDKLSNKLD